MVFNFKGNDYSYPATLAEITLQQRIDLHVKYGIAYENSIKELLEIEDENKRIIDEAELKILFACQCFSFFTGIPHNEIIEGSLLPQVMEIYNTTLSKIVEGEGMIQGNNPYQFNGETWNIPSPQLQPNSKIIFNEFITSKEIVRQLEQAGKGKWLSLLYLSCIYFRKIDEPFSEGLLAEDGERMKLMQNLPLDKAIAVGYFFEQFNEYLSKSFKKSSGKGIDLSAHFERYGWVSFLSYVAEKGVLFYISNGKSNLDNIKETNLYEVLLWSSEQKEKEEAISHYYEEQQKRN
jgi:hypothetical protein